MSEIVADRLAHQYEAAVEEVLAMAMRNPGENGEVLKEVCKRDSFLFIIVIYQLLFY